MSAQDPPDTHSAMPFLAHLGELRTRAFRATLSVFGGFFAAWGYHVELYAWLSAPVRHALSDNNLFSIKALQITESIEVYMKLSLVGGLFLASPFVFYQIWAFIAPGLLTKERRMLTPIVAGSVSCFVLGAAFCYLVVLPFMTDFLIKLTIEAPGMTFEPTLSSTVSFSLLMLLSFGTVFELPLFMYVLAAMGLVTARGFLGFYRYWIVIAFILGAVLTPTPDPINQSLMSAPLVVLYGVGCLIAWIVQREPGRRLPRRAIVAVALVLLVLAGSGVALALRGAERGALDDVPADVQQILGVHEASLARWHQQAAPNSAAAQGLAPLGLVESLHIRPLAVPLVLLARFDDGVVVLTEVPDAAAVVRKLALRFQSSAVPAPSGLSTWFRPEQGRPPWRAVAASKRVLWLGTDGGLAHLSAVRQGRAPALAADPQLADRVATLRGAGPLWSLAPTAKGVAGWLPGGAMGQNVRSAAAVLARDRAELALSYECRGPDSAISLRDRLDAWMADSRRLPRSASGGSAPVVADRLRDLALLVARTAESTARLATPGTQDHQELSRAAAEAAHLARELANAPQPARLQAEPATDVLTTLVQPPALAHAESSQGHVTWTIQGELPRLLDALVAPASAVAVPTMVGSPDAVKGKAPAAVAPVPVVR